MTHSSRYFSRLTTLISLVSAFVVAVVVYKLSKHDGVADSLQVSLGLVSASLLGLGIRELLKKKDAVRGVELRNDSSIK